jgi:predicted amidohydrolase YtcJ
MAYAASLGVTTHLDQGAFPATNTPADGAAHDDLYAMHRPWLEAHAEGKATVRLRINFLHMDATMDVPTLDPRLRNTFPFFGDDMLRTGGIGEFISANLTGGPLFDEAARHIAAAGWRAEVHSLTATDFITEIEAFERVDAEHSIRSLRWVVAHVPLITDEYVQRLKALGGGVSLTSWLYLAGTGPSAGPPFRSILESGIPAGMSSDGMQIAPMSPWVHAYYAVTGKNALGDVINDGQQISRADVLRMYTRANQWFLGGPDEGLLGAVEVGRLGDLVVLSDDYFEVEDEELKRLRSVLTVVGGRVVHDTGEVDA